jgi:hypothetical protein
MLRAFKGAVIAAAGTALAVAPGALAQDRIAGEPNMNGVWEALNTANWNLEPHAADVISEAAPMLGAYAGIPAGLGVVDGGEIPYLPDALAKRDENRASFPQGDPEAKCYLPGIPRATYMPFPFQIIQSGGGADILMVYEYASTNRVIHMQEHNEAPIDTWMGLSNGSWDGDTLVIETKSQNGQSWMDRAGNYLSPTATVTERFTLDGPNVIRYEATIEDPSVYSEPWTIRMPLYRRLEENAQILEYKCVPFAEEMLYRDLKPEGVE